MVTQKPKENKLKHSQIKKIPVSEEIALKKR
jgi:hypothetical protein